MGDLYIAIQVLSKDPISKISFAAGGEDEDYSYVTYVAKDRKENRCKIHFSWSPVAISRTLYPV